ncbi:MAG TPA: histidine kinase [Acidimicrobiales bacterium]
MAPLLVDALFAVALAAASLVEPLMRRGDWEHAALLAPCLLLVAECAVLVARRRHPVAVWLAAGVVASAYGLSSHPDPTLHYGVMVAVYSVAAHSSRRTSIRAGVATAAIVLAVLLVDRGADFADWTTTYLTVGTAWLLGESMRANRAHAAGLARRREEEARRAVADERVRLARELHDVTAHHVSVIAVQAEAGQALLPDRPERAAEVLEGIATSAREALGELRRLLGVLREDSAAGGDRVPQPGLGALPALVDQVRAAGLPVDLRVEGDAQPVPAAVDVSAYRIVQEGLTNVLRHAGPCSAAVVVRYEPGAVALEVADDGAGPPSGDGDGLGLVGMRERAAMIGGHLEAGPRPGGGFAVRARLPT